MALRGYSKMPHEVRYFIDDIAEGWRIQLQVVAPDVDPLEPEGLRGPARIQTNIGPSLYGHSGVVRMVDN
jgi:hypothetical protein